MDPLSITASVIAILGVATKASSTVHKLRMAGHAPELFDELLEEIETLRSVLRMANTCFQISQYSHIYDEMQETLHTLLQQTGETTTRLHCVLEFQLRCGEGRDECDRSKVPHTLDE